MNPEPTKRHTRLSSHTPGPGVYIQTIGWNRETTAVFNTSERVRTGLDPAAIETLTGIRSRSFWEGDPIALALGAIRDLTRIHGQEALSTVDGLIVSSSTPVLPLPATATLIAGELGPSFRGIPAFDLAASCSGYLYALSLAGDLIRGGGARTILLLTLEHKSRQLCPIHGPETAILFGDMATATLVTRTPGPLELAGIHLGARGELAPVIWREPDPCSGAPLLRMNGTRVYREAVRTLANIIPAFLAEQKRTLGAMDLFVFHQANRRLLETLGSRLGIDFHKIPLSLDTYGNTSSSSIPLTLARTLEQRDRVPGTVLLGAFGGGATYGVALLTGTGL